MPSSRLPRVAFDTCVFIDFLRRTPDRYPACRHACDEAVAGRLTIVTASVTVAEMGKPAGGLVLDEEQTKTILGLLDQDYVLISSADFDASRLAHRICRRHGVKPMDGIHLACAIRAGVDRLYTYDGVKSARRGKLLPLDGKVQMDHYPPLRICVPPDPPKPPPPPPNLFRGLDR
jgi:predicted nucleic acid-binding protein